jgi:hypothetical protein
MMEKGPRFSVASLVAVALLWLLSLPLIRFTWMVVENWLQLQLHKGRIFSIEWWTRRDSRGGGTSR